LQSQARRRSRIPNHIVSRERAPEKYRRRRCALSMRGPKRLALNLFRILESYLGYCRPIAERACLRKQIVDAAPLWNFVDEVAVQSLAPNRASFRDME
jgi:hypothetical protein